MPQKLYDWLVPVIAIAIACLFALADKIVLKIHKWLCEHEPFCNHAYRRLVKFHRWLAYGRK